MYVHMYLNIPEWLGTIIAISIYLITSPSFFKLCLPNVSTLPLKKTSVERSKHLADKV